MLLSEDLCEEIETEVLDTSTTSGEHQNQLLDCGVPDGDQTVSEILSLLSANSNEDKKVTLPASTYIYMRSKVLSAPKISDVPIL